MSPYNDIGGLSVANMGRRGGQSDGVIRVRKSSASCRQLCVLKVGACPAATKQIGKWAIACGRMKPEAGLNYLYGAAFNECAARMIIVRQSSSRIVAGAMILAVIARSTSMAAAGQPSRILR